MHRWTLAAENNSQPASFTQENRTHRLAVVNVLMRVEVGGMAANEPTKFL